MAATTWCRLRTFLNRLNHINTVHSGRFCSSFNTKHDEATASTEYPTYEVSTAEFHHVEQLLPKETVPDPPEHSCYPTASGWVPPTEISESPSYFVKRTKNHMLPVYLQTSHGGTRKLVMIRKVEGDIWAFEEELRSYLENETKRKVAIQVHEVGRFIRVKGLVQDMVADFLLKKGF